jgi:hypothetical protein
MPSRHRRHLEQLERVGRHAGHSADFARPVSAAAGALEQPRDSLRAADLQHTIYWCKVHSKIK